MAVTLTTDIVADVMRAASPEKLQAAQARLRSIAAGASAGDSAAFAARLAGAGASRKPTPDAEAVAMEKFEAMVLGSFFEKMLPSDATAAYGEGLSGDMWKSIMAQHLGEAVAAQGGIGIASRYLADRYPSGEKAEPLRGMNDLQVSAALDTQTGLSRGLVQELQRKAADALIDSGVRKPEE